MTCSRSSVTLTADPTDTPVTVKHARVRVGRRSDLNHHTMRRTDLRGTQWTVMAAQNAHLVRRVFAEIWNDGDLELADRLFAPGYINHGGLIPDLVRGPEAIKVSVALYRTAFPQFRLTVLDLLAEGQIVAVRWAARKSPDQAECCEAPGGSSEALLGMTFGRVSAGQIAESWTCWDAGAGEAFRMARHIQTLAKSAC